MGSLQATIVDLGVQLTYNGLFNETLVSIENVLGSAQADTVFGSELANVIDGGAGGVDNLNGYGGIDTISYASATRGVIIDLFAGQSFDGTLDQTVNFENAIGSAFNDSIFGTTGPNMIDGGTGGSDYLFGNSGFDTVSFASRPQAAIVDLTARRYFSGGVGGDVIDFDAVIGTPFADTFFGSAAAESFTGGAGADYLLGGGGADSFVYLTRSELGDTIADFSHNIDKIIFNRQAVTGNDSFNIAAPGAFIASAAPAPTTNSATLLYATGTGQLSLDIDGIGAAAAIPFALLTGAPLLTISDFLSN